MHSQGSLRIGVIGTGGMGTRHVMNLQRFVNGADVAAVYDLDPARAQRVADTCGARVMDNPRALIQNENVDAVLIASPDETHADLTLACLEIGKPVLCEKPLATTVSDAERVLNVEVALGRRLVAVGFMRRFDPQHVAVKQAATGGRLGQPLLFKGVHRNASAPYGTTGANILINSAGHDFDSARWLLNGQVQEVYVRGVCARADASSEMQDLLLVVMSFTNHRMATAEVYVNAEYGYEVSAELVCQRGTVVTEQPDAALVRANGQRGYSVPNDWLARFNEAYIFELRDWVDSIQKGQPFHGANAWDGYMAMLITNACIQSLQTQHSVAVKAPQTPTLYQ
jgi:myo-inositol 2-dehydrogenase/D-chiro-inositol 1-dehydrogenase